MDAIDAINRYKRPAQRRQVSVSLSEHDHKRLTQVADQHEISQQDCLRAAVDYFLTEIFDAPAPESPDAAAKAIGGTGAKRPAAKKPAAPKAGQKSSGQTRRRASKPEPEPEPEDDLEEAGEEDELGDEPADEGDLEDGEIYDEDLGDSQSWD